MSIIYIFMYPPITFSVLSFIASSNRILKQNIEAEHSQNKEQNNKLEVACICVIFLLLSDIVKTLTIKLFILFELSKASALLSNQVSFLEASAYKKKLA